MLKAFAMLFCVAAMGLATSCSKDNEDLIVGKWKEAGTTEITEFTKDGYVYFDGARVAKYKVDGDRLLMYYKDANGNFTDDENDWCVRTITHLTDSHMTIHVVVKNEGDYDPVTNTYTDLVSDDDYERVK
ncbi:MAG: hypothetical protein J6I49_09570 [Bacteroidales bacterium]|nr:hypothetical protein [Bacteroidales bacterium]